MKVMTTNEMRSVNGGAACKGKKFGCSVTGSWWQIAVHQVFCSLYWATKF